MVCDMIEWGNKPLNPISCLSCFVNAVDLLSFLSRNTATPLLSIFIGFDSVGFQSIRLTPTEFFHYFTGRQKSTFLTLILSDFRKIFVVFYDNLRYKIWWNDFRLFGILLVISVKTKKENVIGTGLWIDNIIWYLGHFEKSHKILFGSPDELTEIIYCNDFRRTCFWSFG